MIVGIQSSGIGKVDMSQTGGTTDKTKSKDKTSGSFADLMNLAATNPSTTVQTADSATTKNDVDAVKQADTTVSGEKKQTDLNKYTRSDAKTETTRTGAEKTKQNANYFRIVTILRSLLNSGEISKNEYTRAKAYYKKLTGADMVIAG